MVGALPNLEVVFFSTRSTTWSEDMISRLPQTLRRFHLSSAVIANKAFGSFPTELKSLSYYPTDREPLYGEQLAMLPRTLIYFSTDALDEVEDEDLQYLPPTLTSLTSSAGRKLTSSAFRYLPVHCAVTGPSHLVKVQTALANRFTNLPLQDPDPRVLGRPFAWY